MTTRPTEDRPLRDSRFDAAWRAASSEEPPPALDAAILAAAHRQVGAKPQSLSAQAAMRTSRRWWPLAAAATVAVISIGVVQRAGHDDLVAPPTGSAVVSDMPAQSAKSVEESSERAPGAPAPVSTPAPQTRADRVASASGGSAEGRARGDSGVPKGSGIAQAGSSTDATRRDVEAAATPLRKKAEPGASVSAPSERKRDATANAAPPLPEPFPAARTRLDAAAAPDATAGAPAPTSVGIVQPAQRQEAAASPKLAAPEVPAVTQPTPSAAPLMPSAAPPASPAAPSMPRPPAAAFADSARVAAPSAAKTAPGGAATEPRAKDRPPLPVSDWIALIRRLRDEGNVAEAARELAAFRTTHADHEKLLPPDLRDWHPAEK